MTDKEKLNKLKELADKMAHSSEYLASDASYLHNAIYEYRQFIIQHWSEEHAKEDLDEAAIHNQMRYIFDENVKETTLGELKYVGEGNFKDGAQWMKQRDIDKACEWLKHRGCLYIKYTEAGTGFDDEKFLNDFRKAMED